MKLTRQQPARVAQQIAVESLHSQTDEQLKWLGAVPSGLQWRLQVLNSWVSADLSSGRVIREDGHDVRSPWQILVLHYLDVRGQLSTEPPSVTFASLRAARSYADVYQARVNGRLCATVGRDIDSLRKAAAAINAHEVSEGDAAFEIDIFSRIRVRLLWYAGDEELAPSSTLLLPVNIESFFPLEDIVVLSEFLVSRLCQTQF